MSRRHLAATAAGLAAVCALGVAPQTAFAAAGTGTVVDTLTATVVAGGLTIAGAGAAVALNPSPGSWSTPAGTTLLTMTDTTGSTAGWTVTAAYAAVGGVTDLGGANVQVSVTDVVPDVALAPLLTVNGLSPVTAAALTGPVAVMSSGTATGAGISTARVGYRVKVPTTAAVGAVYGGTVTYTIASVR